MSAKGGNAPTIEEVQQLNQELGKALAECRTLLTRIADANVIFPSMCANNMAAWNIVHDLAKYRTKPLKERAPSDIQSGR